MSLLPQHERLIRDSAISAEVAAERGYWSAGAPKDLLRLFGPTQRELVPALVIPTFDARGEHVFCQLRPDSPRVIDGKARKYELPHKARMAIDVPPRNTPAPEVSRGLISMASHTTSPAPVDRS